MRINRPRRFLATIAILALAACGQTNHDTSLLAAADRIARGRVAESARLQAQADASLGEQRAFVRGRAADAARLQAQADASLGEQRAFVRGRAADAARLQAQADASLGERDDS
jgi:hypothetical protein